MSADNVRAAAERLRVAIVGGDKSDPMSGLALAYSHGEKFDRIDQLTKDELTVVKAYLAEHPAQRIEAAMNDLKTTLAELAVWEQEYGQRGMYPRVLEVVHDARTAHRLQAKLAAVVALCRANNHPGVNIGAHQLAGEVLVIAEQD